MRGASKAITAQYLAELLEKEFADGSLDADTLRGQLPPYVVAAIVHVTAPFELNATVPAEAPAPIAVPNAAG